MGCGASKQQSNNIAPRTEENEAPAAQQHNADASAAAAAPANAPPAQRAASAGAARSGAAAPKVEGRRLTSPAIVVPPPAPQEGGPKPAPAANGGAPSGPLFGDAPPAPAAAPQIAEEPPLPERPRRSRKYVNVGPQSDLLGADVTEAAMFDDAPTTQLYHYTKGDTWYFYNDARDCDAVAEYEFGPGSQITALGSTKKESVEGGIKCTLRIHPGATEPFIKGTPNGYSCGFATEDVTPEYLEAMLRDNKATVEKAIAAVRAVAGSSQDPEEVLARCIERGVPFVDLFFPPTDDSNFRAGTDAPIKLTAWQRPSEYLEPKWAPHVRIFHDIEPNDIDQGALGDCYFLCSLACIAEHPAMVRDVFSHFGGEAKRREEVRSGAYRVTLNKGGWWHTYVLDSYFPTLFGVPYYARNREDPAELWVQLLEKAQAKAHGSYSAITGGDPLQALQDLSGFPTTRLDKALSTNDPTAFARVHRWANEGALIALSTPTAEEIKKEEGTAIAETRARYEKAGLPLGHSYALLGAVECEGFSLVQIRNPWGNSVEWTGKWADNDELWTKHPNVAKACAFAPSADGTFWMEWADTVRYFSSGGVCFLRSNWFDYRIRAFASGGVPNMAMEINVTRKVEAFVSIHQKDRRGEANGSADAEYASFLIAISRSAGGNKQKIHVHSTLDCEEPTANPNFVTGRDVAVRYTFEPAHSPYVITPRMMEKHDKSFVIGLLTDAAAGDGLSVSFINLTPACPVYENYDEFELKDDVARHVAQYQHNPEVGAPITKTGDSIQL